MAILALNRRMGGGIEHLQIFVVALGARFPALVFDREIFPLLDIAQTVEAVGEVPAVYAKIVGNKEDPGDQNRSDQSDCYPQWAQDVPLHLQSP